MSQLFAFEGLVCINVGKMKLDSAFMTLIMWRMAGWTEYERENEIIEHCLFTSNTGMHIVLRIVEKSPELFHSWQGTEDVVLAEE